MFFMYVIPLFFEVAKVQLLGLFLACYVAIPTQEGSAFISPAVVQMASPGTALSRTKDEPRYGVRSFDSKTHWLAAYMFVRNPATRRANHLPSYPNSPEKGIAFAPVIPKL
jgi:hypothetical protein